jgi:hypothetical protein
VSPPGSLGKTAKPVRHNERSAADLFFIFSARTLRDLFRFLFGFQAGDTIPELSFFLVFSLGSNHMFFLLERT